MIVKEPEPEPVPEPEPEPVEEVVEEEVVEEVEEAEEVYEESIEDYFEEKYEDEGEIIGADEGTGSGESDSDQDGNSATPGEGDQGSSETGDSDTDGKADSGNSGDDFGGDGLISRKVIKRPDLSELNGLAEENGRIVINLCISKDGKVVFSEFNEDESTISTPYLIAKSESLASTYRYEKDYSAETRQCGKLSFKIDGIE